MSNPIAVGTQAQTSAGSSVAPSITGTTGETLVALVSWIDVSSSTATALSVPAGWTAAYNPTGFASVGNGRGGLACFFKTAAGGSESCTINTPGSAGSFYANAILYRYAAGMTHDTADAPATTINNAAASTTGVTVPDTNTLSGANSAVLTGVSIFAGTGLANAAIAFSGGSWTTDLSDQDTSVSVGSLFGHKSVSATTPLNAVYTWTSDASMFCYQAAVVVFSDAGGGGGGSVPLMGQACL